MYHSIQPYDPPSWAQRLPIKPTSRTVLCMRPTPIHKWELPGVPGDFQVWVKRDDLTGSTLSGNKVRKLEFFLADAIQQGCDTIVTAGRLQSNHCRTTAVAARELGLKTHVILISDEDADPAGVPCDGNLLLNRLSAATMVISPVSSKPTREEMRSVFLEQPKQYAEELRKQGIKAYFIPLGGTSPIGEWGYIDAFQEMIDQGIFDKFDDIVVTVGSGGSACGLAIANYLTGSKVKVHGVCMPVGIPLERYYIRFGEMLAKMGITDVSPRSIIDLVQFERVDRAISLQEELSTLIVDVFTNTGITLGPEHTAQGVKGMLAEMTANPSRFAGKRVLFIQTGGIYELFDGSLDRILRDTAATNQVYKSTDAHCS